jgi:hypothetical protein
MIDLTNCTVEKVIIHNVGNKTNGEALLLSTEEVDISDAMVYTLLQNYFLKSFAKPEFYNFTFSNNDFNLNPLYSFASKAFDDNSLLLEQSNDIAKLLYELSIHPQIKSGDLFVVHFSNANIYNQICDAIGIFKSENRQDFLKVEAKKSKFSIRYEDGINVDKLDKGCLIFNVEKENGYKVCAIDNTNRGSDAHYWKNEFVKIKPCADEFHHTQNFLSITKNYVSQQLPEEFDVSKTEQIDLLNRSMGYFKEHKTFVKEEFEQEVLQDEKLIQSFRQFDGAYRQEHEIELDDNFDISSQAIKKQARVFKSVLKLDKNFHIYIHGNRDMIEQGVDENGRKYYKIFYKEEN